MGKIFGQNGGKIGAKWGKTPRWTRCGVSKIRFGHFCSRVQNGAKWGKMGAKWGQIQHFRMSTASPKPLV